MLETSHGALNVCICKITLISNRCCMLLSMMINLSVLLLNVSADNDDPEKDRFLN